MKKYCLILIFILCISWLLPLRASASGVGGLLSGNALSTEQYSGTAKAAILYECNTDTIVYGHQMDLRMNPTGLIKVLTALIALEKGNLDDVVTVRRSTLNSVAIGSVSANLQAGEQLTLRSLLFCIMVASANDACAVVAEHIAGSQAAFVKMMNDRAASLGCKNTYFTNVHGLTDTNQYSTARDLAIITAEALRNPDFTSMFGTLSYQVPATNLSAARTLSTTNNMLNPQSPYYDERVTGGKPAAASTKDRSIVCTAEKDGCRYICIILSAEAKMSGTVVSSFTNFKEATALLTKGIKGYSIQQVLGKDRPYGMFPVLGGENDVAVCPDESAFALLPKGFDKSVLQFEPSMDATALVAPVVAGQIVGNLKVSYNGVTIGNYQLRALHDVAKAGTVIQPAPSVEKSGISLRRVVLFGIAGVVGIGLAFFVVRRRPRRSSRREF